MKILVIGGGGREHALVWKLRQSPSVSKLWCAPGNAGIAQDAECIPADLGDIKSLADLATNLGADITLVGPEQPLVLGIADEFAARRLNIIGPAKASAQLEGSKLFAKDFLRRHGVPTGRVYAVCDTADQAHRVLASCKYSIVLKADGLCSGKGVLVAQSQSEADAFVRRVLVDSEFGSGGSRLLIEEALSGLELSYIVLVDGQHYVPLMPARDHKRALNGDQGGNTGGMGAYSSDTIIAPEIARQIQDQIVEPTLKGLAADGLMYRGFLYFGLMLTPTGPQVLEFNCRLGDPETQALIPRLETDLAEILASTAAERLHNQKIVWRPGASISVVMASAGYPGTYQSGLEISGLDDVSRLSDVSVFHSGTTRKGTCYYTCSGRVLAVSATGENLGDARKKAYDAVNRVHFTGAHFRTDIGANTERQVSVEGVHG